MENTAENLAQPEPIDEHYSYIRSINNDLVLLGNALMTKNNDINSIHDFVSDSINTIKNLELKDHLHDLNEKVIGCDNDEDRLRLMAQMQHKLVEESLIYLDADYQNSFEGLSHQLNEVTTSKGDALKADISRFQIDVLKFIPGIKSDEHSKLYQRAAESLMAKGKDLNHKINELYEEINVLIQPSFDDIEF
ncbi:MAG: hypothetical protein K9M07_00135 [Simkaniaceae bacterium]|nr:hypothetical protein [Simkaniaceae bacterium]